MTPKLFSDRGFRLIWLAVAVVYVSFAVVDRVRGEDWLKDATIALLCIVIAQQLTRIIRLTETDPT